MAQAERLRERLASTGEIAADVLIASTLPRARETAEIIAPALGLPILWDDDVQEMRPGVADGMSLDDYREKVGIPSTQRAGKGLQPMGDIHASEDYRAHLTRVFTRRALKRAIERART